jgi:hypothetical protein
MKATNIITTDKSYTDKLNPWELRIDGKLEGRFRTKKQALANAPKEISNRVPSKCFATRLNHV